MTDLQDILIDSTNRLLNDISGRDLWSSSEKGIWPEKAWAALVEMGLAQALVSDESDSPSAAEALPLAELAGYHALPVPLAEAMVGNYLLASAGLPTTDQPMALACPDQAGVRLSRVDGQWCITGSLRRVAWGHDVPRVLLTAQTDHAPALVNLSTTGLSWRTDTSLAGEPRDSCNLDGVSINAEDFAAFPAGEPSLLEWGALIRSLQMAGAMRRVLELSVQYANERVQFGRPIGKFQAVQQQLAAAAGQVAAAGAAANSAVRQVGTRDAGFAIAVAKSRVGEAAGLVAAIGHQVHAAMGFTQEHTLHYSTRRLWSWRDEFGNEAFWQQKLGALAAAQGRDGLWPYLTSLQEAGRRDHETGGEHHE
ncbi:acyl-CoA dehydrogenase family protein [Marinobacter vinifirmus]|uniref:Acyl-CoA dehydrogenase n=1 Tax=Marinobacter vinifirmus TaxID=355591 RepID=A0A558B2F0_9GAMM|nr:acyl-CoA dehydrogenase family protein [Marinobacter vinifirmus]TVT30692.1 MAG: acyl-CoA dehydrogenase [Marinobacter vinifirmus]